MLELGWRKWIRRIGLDEGAESGQRPHKCISRYSRVRVSEEVWPMT